MKIAGWVKVGGVLLILSMPISASTVEKYLVEAAKKAAQGDLTSAAVLYQKVLKLEDNNVTARKGLAAVLMEARMKDPHSEQTDAELAVIREAVPDKPLVSTQIPLYYLNNATLSPHDGPLNFEMLLALTQLQKGDNDSGIKTANILQRRRPKDPIPHNLLGLAWSAKGEFNKARVHYQKALSLKPDFYAASINLAELNMRSKDYAQARQVLAAVLKQDRNNRSACLSMVKLCHLERKTAEAQGWYQQASKRF